MEQLIVDQKESFNELNRLITNYGKDSQARKTKPEYFLKKICAFEEIWESVKERHELLMPFATADQPYFAENTYTKMNDIYEKTTNELKSKYIEKGGVVLSVVEQQSAKASTTAQAAQTKPNKSTMLEINHDELLDLIIGIEHVVKKPSIGYMKTHLDLMKNAWSEFRKSYAESQLKADEETNINFTEVQQLFIEACGKINDAIQLLESCKNDAMNLPKLRLPDFDGKNTPWYTFIGLFNKMVHDKTTIDDGIKMEYLKTCIKGAAAKMINHLEPTAENYRVCYEILRNRYDNKRAVLGKLIDSMLNLPKMKEENSAQLRTMHDTVHECTLTIKNMGVEVNGWDPLLVHIFLQKLDKDTIKHYNSQLKDIKELRKLSEFLSYIESRFMAIQSSENKNEYNKNEYNKDNMNQQPNNFNAYKPKMIQNKCLLCNESHLLSECEQFLSKPANECYDIAKNKKLCINCLSPSHVKNHCKSKFNCKKCKKRHHTLLHLDNKGNQVKEFAANASEIQKSEGESNFSITRKNNFVMLATAMVGVLTKSGEKVIMRMLIDQGSQASYITENALRTLKLPKQRLLAKSTGIGENAALSTNMVSLKIVPIFESSFVLTTDAIVMKKLTNYSADLRNSDYLFENFNNLRLADPNFKTLS